MKAVVAGMCVAALGWQNAFGAEMKVQLAEQPLEPAAITQIGGFVGQRYRANKDGYLKTFHIDMYVRMVEERTHTNWWWIGEQDGKWIESTVLVSKETGDAELRRKAEQMLARVIASQEPEGYVGITPQSVRTPQQPLRGMDPYELYFTLHGFITAYEQWGDKTALEAAKKLGDYFEKCIGPGKAEFWPSDVRAPANVGKKLRGHSAIAGHSVHYGWEGTLLIDPMLRLYQVTGDKKYLDWSRWVIGNIDKWSGWNAFSKLDQVADGKMGINEVQPYVHAHTFQMNFQGFLRMYQITGDPALRDKVVGAWNDIANRQMYITGGVSVGEHYEAGHNLPITGPVVETCASMSWIELTQYLLELTADPKYADAIEKLLWNHLYAAQTVDGDCNRYHTPLNGTKPAGYFHGPDCCTSSGHRIQSKVPLLIYATGRDGIYVNQFVDSTANITLASGNAVAVRQQTDFPAGEKVALVVTPKKSEPFTLFVRLPAWCENPKAAVNGEPVAPLKPGSYLAVKREWKQGDRVDLTLPMQPRWVKGAYTTQGMHALVRGPLVYSLDTVWWLERDAVALDGVPPNLAQTAFVEMAATRLTSTAVLDKALGPGYKVKVKLLNGQVIEPVMLPFANTGQWYRPGSATKPRPNEEAFAYAVWLRDAGDPAFQQAVEARRQDEELKARSVDFVVPADAASEKAHGLRGERDGAGYFNGRGWRHAVNGWFSYEIKVLSDVPQVLVCAYWGSERSGREFDILIDGTKIATQTLENNRPDDFFTMEYPIPAELTKGKQSVTVRFSAHESKTAGGVFGVRVVETNQ
jgi:DUF1680 family protein